MTQKAIALWPAEAELHVATHAICEAKGLESLGRHFCENLRMVAWVDAQATIGVSSGSGQSKARHSETTELKIQQVSERGECERRKIGGERTPADTLTKPVLLDVLVKHLARLGCHLEKAVGGPNSGQRPTGLLDLPPTQTQSPGDTLHRSLGSGTAR